MRRLALLEVGVDEADDLTQEVLVRAWKRWSTYCPERGPVRPWLLAITKSLARRHRQRRSTPMLPAPAAGPDVESTVDLIRAVMTLPIRQRQAVLYHYWGGFTVDETATLMGCRPGTVKSQLSDARSRLAGRLAETIEDTP